MARLIIHVNQKEDEALGYLKKALEIDENNFTAYLSMLQILLIKGKTEGVAEIIQKAIRCATGEGSLTEIMGLKTVFEESQKCAKELKDLREKK